METRLRLVLRDQQLRLALKALIFGGGLALVKIGSLGLLPILFFLGIALFLYTSPLFNSFNQSYNLLILIAISLLAAGKTLDSGYFLLIWLGAVFLFYLILGIKDLILINRSFWQSFLNFSLFYASAVLFFYSDLSKFFLLDFFGLFLAALVLIRNLYARKILVALLAAFIISEITWLAALLPLGPINAASLVFLTYFTLTSLIARQADQSLNKRLILRYLTVFVILLVIIFGTTKWGI